MFDPGPAAEVGCTATEDGRWTLRFVRDLQHPPERVWRMLTEPDRLARWAPFTTDRGLDRPGPATLTMIDGPTEVPMEAEVLVAEEARVLVYTWGADRLRWELEPDGAATRLTLWHTTGDRDFVSKVAAGWHLCVRVMELDLNGMPHPPVRGQDAMHYGWADLEATYRKTLEI